MIGEPEPLENLVEMLEYDEPGESDDMWAERSRSRRSRQPRTAPGRATMPRRPQPGNFVTEAQLQAALATLNREIRTNSAAIQTVSTRINAVAEEQTTQRRQTDALRRDINQKLQMSSLIPLVAQRTREIDQTSNGLVAGDKVQLAADPLIALFPLMMGNLSGGQGGSPGSDSSSDMTPMLMVIALSGAFNK